MSKQSDLVNVAQDAGTDGYVKVTDASTSGTDYLITSGSRYKFFGSEANNVEIGSYSASNTSRNVHMSIDSSGNVAVANTRPTTDFDVGGRNMVIGNGSGDQGITIYSSSSGAGNIWFADGGGSTEEIVGGITYDHSANALKFRANNSEVARARSDGWFAVTGNGSIPSATLGVAINKNGRYLSWCDSDWNLELGGSQGNRIRFYSSNGSGTQVGSIRVTTSSTSYNTSSDYRLKENVVALDGAADRLAQIPVHRFNFIDDPDTTVDGFLAHEVQAFVPEAITGEHDGVDADGNPEYQGIDQSKLVPLLTAALQEALQKIDALEARVAELEAV